MSKASNEIVFNLITLGDSGVGKTSLYRRFLYNLYDDNTISTIGLSFAFKEVILDNKKKVKLKLIDTGGQEKYRAIAKTYFKNAEGVLFVYSIDDVESFNNIKDWIILFNENNNGKKGIPQILVETKNDLERKVNEEESKKFANDNKLILISTSAKTNKNVDDLFKEMAENIYKVYSKTANSKQKNLQLENEPKREGGHCCLFTSDE
jgi:small GTP-binding protein